MIFQPKHFKYFVQSMRVGGIILTGMFFLLAVSAYAEKIQNSRAVQVDRDSLSKQNPNSKSATSNPDAALLRSLSLGKDSKGGKDEESQPGLDANRTPPWSEWEPLSPDVEIPEVTHIAPSLGPTTILDSLDQYKTVPRDNPATVALKVDDMISSLAPAVVRAVSGDITHGRSPQILMDKADDITADTKDIYSDIFSLYVATDAMKAQLSRNYGVFNETSQSQEAALELNAKSDAMAERAVGMNRALKGMLQQAQAGRELVQEMPQMFEATEKDGQEAVKYFDRFAGQVSNAANLFEGAARDLKGRGLDANQTFDSTRRYLSELKQFSNDNKSHILSQLDYVRQSKTYVQNTDKFITNTVRDIETASKDIQSMESYFRSAKVQPAPGKDIVAAFEGEGSVCDGAKKEDLKELQDCAKDCRSVCRFKEKVGDTYCYECPSGSPDSCYDVGAWPDNHPWCQPGGVCHSDPMLYCEPFGTTGPNLEHLSCTNCKKRPDMCWQNVGDGTMTYTNCMLGCWDGECVYKGKYKETEWDGSPEFLHCYKCETPPGPPSCEDLGWGTTLYSDCKANCPDPGDCEKVTMGVPGKPQPGQDGEDDGQQDGEDDGGKEGEETGGTQAGGTPPQGGARTGNPPEGTPGQPGGGGAAATAGGAPSAPGAGGQPTGGETPTGQQPPPAPTTHQPNSPQPPTTSDQPEPPGNPPAPPDNPTISFYRSWLDETKDRIKSRDEIIEDPKTGEYTHAEATRQRESMTKEKEYLESRVHEEEQRESDRQQKTEEEKKRREEFERTRERPRDYGAEMRRADFEYKANKLKEATDALKAKLEEARDILTARRERIKKIDEEIEQIRGRSTQTRETQQRLKDLLDMRRQFSQRLNDLERQYREEIEKLRVEYQRRLWSVDERSRRRAEATRIDEYFDKLTELRDRQQTQAIRNETFESVIKGLEEELKTAEANGDDDRVDELRSQIENVKRAQAEWQESTDRQIKRMEDELYEMEYRNGYEGAGPTSPERLAELLDQYRTSIQNDINAAEKTIADLERIGTRTAERERVLRTLKERVGTLRSAVDDLQAKRDAVVNGTQFSDEDRQRVIDSTTRVANGSMNRQADKSFARLFAESLGEEYVHNLNPLVMGKKTVAFTVGMAQGVGSAVAGLAELGWEALDTIGESIAVDLGFEDGGVFGTENLDTINNALSGISSVNFDSVINLVVAGGKMIDNTLTELSRSGDIDWATAKLGGRIAGEVVVGDAVIAGALGKAGTLLRGADEAADVGRAAGAIDNATDLGRAGSRVDDIPSPGSTAGRTEKFPDFEAPGTTVVDDATGAGSTAGKTEKFPDIEAPGSAVVDDAADVGTGVTKADEAPGSTPRDAPANRGPPDTPGTTPRAGIGPNAQATVTGPDGKPMTIKTGEELGHGSTSTVFADATNPRKAIRITEPGKGGITEAPKLDAAGRQAVESIQRPNGPIRIAEKGDPFTVTDPNSPLKGKIVEVVERVENGSADNFLKNQPGGTMTQGQAQAFADATKELNKNGFAWMDNHTGNYGYEKIPGTADDWRVVVLDPGGIVPMKGATTAEKAASATALQNRLNAMDPQLADMVNNASPGFRKNMAMMERGAIFEEFGGTIDAAGMGLKSPHDIAFYPFGTSEFPQVRSLFQ